MKKTRAIVPPENTAASEEGVGQEEEGGRCPDAGRREHDRGHRQWTGDGDVNGGGDGPGDR